MSKNNKNNSNYSAGGKKSSRSGRVLKIVFAVLLIGILVFGWVKGYIGVDENGRFFLLRNPVENPVNNVNTVNTLPSGPKYYTSDVLDSLINTDIFNSSALEHIFLGTVNSNNKGSGYHYSMISDAPGKIVEGTRSDPDPNGLYTANVTVDGHKKDNFSTFYPDSWSPQQVVDAINEAREEALRTGTKDGSYYVGHGGGLRINLYLDSKNKVVTAFPIYNGK